MGGVGSGRPLSPEGVVRRMSLQNRGSVVSPNMIMANYGGLRKGARKTADDPFITQSEADASYSNKYRYHVACGSSTARSAGGTFALESTGANSINTGYLMVRSGSVTGLSAKFEVTAYTGSAFGITARFNLRKNGISVLQTSSVDITGTGTYKTYLTQAEGTTTYSPNDEWTITITIQIGVGGSVTIDDAVCSAELTEEI